MASAQTINWVGRGVTGSTVGATISGTSPTNHNWAGSVTPTTSQVGYIVIDNPAGLAGVGLTHTTAMNIGHIFIRNTSGAGFGTMTLGGAAGTSGYTLTAFTGWGQIAVRFNNTSTLFGTITGDALFGDGTSSFIAAFTSGTAGGTLVVGGNLISASASSLRGAGPIKISADTIHIQSGASLETLITTQPFVAVLKAENVFTNAGLMRSLVVNPSGASNFVIDGTFINETSGEVEFSTDSQSTGAAITRAFTITAATTNKGSILVRSLSSTNNGKSVRSLFSIQSGDVVNLATITLLNSATDTASKPSETVSATFNVFSGNFSNSGQVNFDNRASATANLQTSNGVLNVSGNLSNGGTFYSVNVGPGRLNTLILANGVFTNAGLTTITHLLASGTTDAQIRVGTIFNNAGTLGLTQSATGVAVLSVSDLSGGVATLLNAATGLVTVSGARATLNFTNATLSNAGTIAATSGGVIVLGEVVSQTGTLTANSATIEALKAFANHGFVGLTNGQLRMAAGELFTNNHRVSLGGTITGDVTNNGSLTVASVSTITGAFTNNASGSVAVSGGNLHLTSATAPVNSGTIFIGARQLNVAAVSWTNAGYVQVQGGSIRTGNGAGLFSNAHYISTGSSIDSNFANFGTFELTNHTSITGNFTNAGWTSPSGFALSLRSNFANEGDGITTGVLSGAGTVSFAPTSGNATFTNTATNAAGLGGNYNTSAMRFTMDSGTINFEVTSTDMGSGAFSQLTNGFALGTLTLPNTMTLMRLLDNHINQGGGTQEAIYVNNLHLGSALTASNFDFGGSSLKIYYNHIIGDGGVNFVGTYDGPERVIYFNNIIPMGVNPGSAVVPEPSTLALMALGVPVLWFAWRRRARK
jgi:hypothetical protein